MQWCRKIIKPFIESIYGKDLVTREKLTDFERGMQLVIAAVGAVTLGQGAMALNFAEMSGKEIAAALVKTWAVDAASDVSAYTVGYACDELGMPASVTFLASLATGCTVSVKAGKYVFQDANSNIVKELDSYDLVAGEIISRKATDLDKISEKTYRGYLSEISEKYSVGTVIRSNKYPELDGLKLEGQYILEIPDSNQNLSNIKYFEDIAEEYGVKLRYTEE